MLQDKRRILIYLFDDNDHADADDDDEAVSITLAKGFVALQSIFLHTLLVLSLYLWPCNQSEITKTSFDVGFITCLVLNLLLTLK